MADERLPEPAAGSAAASEQGPDAVPSIAKIRDLLQSKDDTSRFVGLALLKSVLDNSPDLQQDGEVIQSLWNSISPKFLARLLKTGSHPGSDGSQARDMLDLAVAVLHTFAVLLPDAAKRDDKLLNKIPALVAAVLYSLDLDLIPQTPSWLNAVVTLIPYTNCAGTLLLLYPETMPSLLFRGDASTSSKPFSFLFISLIMVDIRATLPSLLDQLNDSSYPQTSRRLTSAMDILTAFIGHLIAYIERLDGSQSSAPTVSTTEAFNLEPDLMIKLSKSIAETVSLTMEFLRDRWDAAVAGAQGLHVEARAGQAHTSSGSHKTLAWDSKGDNASTDPLTLSAIRAIALWLRDDDGDTLREQGAGLVDMLLELYQSSTPTPTKSNPQGLDYRLPALTALEGILRTSVGIEAFNTENGWQILTKDLLAVLSNASDLASISMVDAIRGTRIVFVLGLVIETERNTPESWMDVVTGVAALSVPAEPAFLQDPATVDLFVDVVWLAASLLRGASAGMRARYVHSISAMRGISQQLKEALDPASKSASELTEAHAILGGM
ncbi:Neurochondrin-domain-containing protein [Microdochium bolleyi]|uniref:Neurochondrin-domain-containing protein n=1 Tax=Microdochium bolleyi TaxID=196109 RepID=A0A136JAP0_9PEZI|nr:Neurochondrin-domain-containing protein [Microdochium bolleyi]